MTVGLTALKLVSAWISHSVGMFSEGIHSSLDLVSAGISFFTVRHAGKPADQDHPFGHGKIETLSSLFESLFLVLAAALIVFEGIDHLSHPVVVEHEWVTFTVISISVVLSYLAYRHNLKAAEATESSALHVNALHFLSDVVASLGVLFGLVLLHFTGWLIVDPLIAFAVALYILAISAKQVKGALVELSDTQLPEAEIQRVHTILSEFDARVIEAHELRTRKSGATRHIDFHLVLCRHMTVERSHSICDEIEKRFAEEFPTASVHIHVEPCEKETPQCQLICTLLERPSKPGIRHR